MATWRFWRRNSPQKTEAIKAASPTVPEMILFGTRSTRAIYQKWDVKKATEEGLKASATFYACARIRAQAFASVKWKVYRELADGTCEELPKHPLQTLIKKPHPAFSWAELMQMCSYHLDLAGNFYLKEIRAGNEGYPVEVAPLMPKGVAIVPDPFLIVGGYEYTPPGSATKIPIPANDVVQIKTIDPDNFMFGLPTIMAAGRGVDTDREAGDWQKASFQNRGVSDVAVVLDQNTTQEQYDSLKAHYKEEQAGPTNARAPWFTTKDVKIMNQSAVEMDFINSRQSSWQEIATAMGVPLPMIGVLTDATLANIQTSRRIFWLDTMIPLLDMVRAQLDDQLSSEFGPDIRIKYDTSDVDALADDFLQKLEQAAKLFGLGVDLRRINTMLELDIPDVENLEGADIGYLPAGLIPVGADLGIAESTTGQDNQAAGAMAYGEKPLEDQNTPENTPNEDDPGETEQ